MNVMILAAGLGTRLAPLTDTCPKPLVPLMLQPMLSRLLMQLRQYPVDEVVINLHHHAEQIRQWLGDGEQWGFRKIHLSHEPEILGTAGAMKQAEAMLGKAPFCVMNADVLADINLEAVWHWHQQHQAVVTMVLRPDPEAQRYGPVVVDDNNRVCHINGRPEVMSHLRGEAMMFTGIQVISPEILADVPPGQFMGTTSEVYPQLIANGDGVYGYRYDGYWIDIGVPEYYRQAHWDLLDGVLSGEPVTVSEGTDLIRHIDAIPTGWEQVTIQPPVVVGPGAELAAGACLGPYAVLGPECRVGAGACVRESVLWDSVQIGAQAQVERSILGTRVVVSAGQVVFDAVQATASGTRG